MTHVESVVEILVLQAQLENVNAQIAKAREAAKILKKIESCKLTHKTSHKYFSLQETYMARTAG